MVAYNLDPAMEALFFLCISYGFIIFGKCNPSQLSTQSNASLAGIWPRGEGPVYLRCNSKTHRTMNIYNVIILDESGSMSSIYKETLQSINEVLVGIRKNQEEHGDQQHNVTIVTFEGNGIKGIKTRRDRVPINDIEDFTEKDYRPGGCTPLYDAMGQTLNRLEGLVEENDKVMATIITDGFENSSEEYSGKTVKSLVGRLREKGWVFAYIGANQDAIEVARDLNISNALNYDASPEGMLMMSVRFREVNRKMSEGVARKKEPGFFDMLFDSPAQNDA